ncbi:MAG: hypothetical protein K8M05_30445 [Deltaproteobacteria bacterium]|nr:hypothetical protein [Kofleriaceae bacterium]
MAKKGSRTGKPASRSASASTSAPAPAAARVTPARDPRRWIYIGADIVFTIGFLWAFSELLHNRFGWARGILYVLPACTLIMAVGTAVRGKWGWIATLVGGTGMILWAIAFIIVLLVTASYLSGVYGAFGKAAASGAILSTAFVVQFAATLPALQMKWAMTRGGRRAFGLTPLWPRPAA